MREKRHERTVKRFHLLKQAKPLTGERTFFGVRCRFPGYAGFPESDCGSARIRLSVGYCFARSRSIVRLTSSPTTAAGTFAPMPKSVRWIVVEPEKPECCFLSIPVTGPVGPFTSKTTGLVTPCKVRLPEIDRPPPLLRIPVLTKVAVGNCATSKKFALFRSASRP